jgi:DMSO/TMAO reductase YedYZ molybdopterin-dependent catalytic subunit
VRKMVQRKMKNVALVIIACTSIFLTGCNLPVGTSPLPEIREYEGQALSSVNDFRENSIKGPPDVDIQNYRLKISGLVANPREYKYDEVITNHAAYKKVVKMNCVEGWGVTLLWEGVLLKDLLAEAGMKPEAKIVIFHSVDGYTTSLPVEYFTGNDILLAYKMNEVPIPPVRGFPFMVVAENKWGYKWAKWVNEIELSDDLKYRGYWESRGYSNTGDYPGIFFDNPLG